VRRYRYCKDDEHRSWNWCAIWPPWFKKPLYNIGKYKSMSNL